VSAEVTGARDCGSKAGGASSDILLPSGGSIVVGIGNGSGSGGGSGSGSGIEVKLEVCIYLVIRSN
jgi:hypothetical protein